jgi:leucyl aminopeptidase
MEVNLRKANAIQHEIKNAIRALEAPTRVDITEFENGEDAIAKTKEKALEARRSWDDLTKTLYDIRRKVGVANTTSGIDTALSEVAEIDDRVAMLRHLVAPSAQRMEPEVLAGRLNKLKDSPRETHHYAMPDEKVTTGIYTADEIEAFNAEIANLRRRKRALQDDLLAMNVQNTIGLTDESITCLQGAGIV